MRGLSMLIPLCFIASATVSCGGGGGDSDSNSGTLSGKFIDSAVQGLNYTTETQSGTTDVNGTFHYLAGETVQFSIGDINLPPVLAKSVITPLDVAQTSDINDTTVTNIVRLLMTLDTDYDAGNGISIGSNAHTTATGMSITFSSTSFDTDVTDLVQHGGGSSVLVESFVATIHFQHSLDQLASSGNTGTSIDSTALAFLDGNWRNVSSGRIISCNSAERECTNVTANTNIAGLIGEPDTTGQLAIKDIQANGAVYSAFQRWSRYDTSTLQFNYFVWPETTITLTSQDSFTVLAHGGPGTVLENLSLPYGTTSEYVRVDSNLDTNAEYSYIITEAFDGDWNSLGVNVCIEGWDAGGQLGYTPYPNPGRCPSAYTTSYVCNWTELGVEGTTYLPDPSALGYNAAYACSGFYGGTLQ